MPSPSNLNTPLNTCVREHTHELNQGDSDVARKCAKAVVDKCAPLPVARGALLKPDSEVGPRVTFLTGKKSAGNLIQVAQCTGACTP